VETNRDILLDALQLADRAKDQRAILDITGQLEAIDGQDSTQPPEKEPIGFLNFLKENAKRGSVEGIGMATGLASALNDEANQLFGGEESNFLEKFSQTAERNTESSLNFLQSINVYDESDYSSEELRQADVTGGVATSAIRAVTDPLGLLGAPIKAVPLAIRGVGNFLGGAAADVGAKTVEAAGGGQGAQMLGALAGGTLVGIGEGSKQVAYQTARSSLAGDTLEALDKASKRGTAANINALETSMAGQTAKNLLKDAAENDFSDLDATIKNFDSIKDVIGVEGFPVMVQLADNETLRQKYLEMIKRNPKFRANIEKELDGLVAAINNKSDALFGTRGVKFEGATVSPKIMENVRRAQQTVSKLDEKLSRASSSLETSTNTEIGTAIKNIVAAKEVAVRESMSGDYEALKLDATAAGATLPAQGTKVLHQYVQFNNIRDLFGVTSKIDRDVLSKLKPKKKTLPNGTAYEEYQNMSFEQVLSLKNAVNRELRNAGQDAARISRLSQFKEVLDEQRTALGEFDVALREIDKSFYERMGLPFDNRTIHDLGAKGYVEQVAPVLMRPSAAKQFITTVGEEQGTNILQNTIMSKLYSDVVDGTGKINQNRFNSLLNKNSEVIALVPGLRTKLEEVSLNNSDLLRAHKASMDELKIARDDRVVADRMASNPDFQIQFDQIAKSPNNFAQYSKYLDQVKMFDPKTQVLMNNRLKREVVAQAVSNKGSSGLQWLTDPNNSSVVEAIMGDQYMKDLKGLALLSDNISKVDPAKILMQTRADQQDPGMRAMNVPFTQTASVMRDRIMSAPQKVLVLLSKANSNRLEAATDNKMTELFLDPDTVRKMVALSDKAKKGGGTDWGKFLSNATSILAERVVQLNVSAMSREQARQSDKEAQAQQQQQQ
tara:strand:- start:198 stop:2882 length:2685 start_codon:yes stop_codon:yes gene_type:complete